MSHRLLNLGSALMAGAAIGGLYAALVTGSLVVALVAIACAVNGALLQGLAYTRAAGGRMDAILDEVRAPRSATSDHGRA